MELTDINFYFAKETKRVNDNNKYKNEIELYILNEIRYYTNPIFKKSVHYYTISIFKNNEIDHSFSYTGDEYNKIIYNMRDSGLVKFWVGGDIIEITEKGLRYLKLKKLLNEIK